MSKLETNTIDTVSGTSTLQVGSTNTTTITLGVSGDTINVPSGVTIANSGTATGFGGTNTPAFFAFANSNFTLSTSTFHKIPFNDEKFDTASAFDTSTNAFTVPSGQAGKYFLSVAIRKNNSRTDRNLLDLRVNDTGVLDTETGSYSNYGVSLGSIVISLSVGDVVNAYIYHDRGSNQEFRGGSTAKDTIFQGYKIIE
mgnify:CR=1 FL=1|tara:strand:+ start:27 stop:620 length:594 start_codon:yes stop_codon:yes gene_type:complete